ncbi:MAG: hypothetical protein JNM63_08685, partial [Spirochaetia bacterium]|nr:hypothetical protein [Spirochaetia bacterium]
DWLWAQPSVNQAPVVDAGNNFIYINQSNSVVNLSGTASDDGVPSALKTSWKRRAGPSRVTFANSNALVTTMSVETTNQNIITNRIRLNAEDGQFKTLDEIFLVYTPPSDTTAPVVTASHYDRTTNEAFTLNLYTTEDNGYYSVNGGAFVSFAAPMTSLTIASTSTVLFYGRDSLGNTSVTNQRVYTFDTTAPVVTASHYNRTTNQAFTLNLYTTEDSGYYSVNGGAFVAFAAPKASLTIASTSTVLYYGRDSLGNTSATNQRVYIFDTSAPVVDASIPSLTTNQVFTVALSTTENSGYFSTNGSAFAPYTVVGTNLIISGTTTLLFYGRDVLGNTSATNTRTYTLIWGDITPPTVNASLPSLVTNEVFNVALTTTENFGYFSTNGSPYVSFTTAGTNLTIRETTTLSFYGRDTNGNTSPTNVRFYSMPSLVYENAESGSTNGWVIYDNDPVGSTVANVFDAQKNSRVIQVSGSGLINGYRRYLADGKSYWRDRVRPIVQWSMKYSENFIVYLDVVTTGGNKYITYDASTNEKWLGTNTAGVTNYVFHGLGTGAKNGTWQTFTRDLGADLADLLPLESLVEVNGFMIRGSG